MDTKELKYLLMFLSAIALIGFCLSILIGVVSIMDNGLFRLPLCFNNECVGYLLNHIKNATNIANSTLGILVSVTTIGGIFVALLSYLNSSNTSALSNHIAHFSIFHGYLNSEVGNLSMVSPSSVDILSLYNFIFSESRRGKTEVSQMYIDFVKDLNNEINASNSKAQMAEGGSFRYKEHQRRIISILNDSGITMTYLPRNDFFEAEGQVFSLIEKVNQSFCYTNSVPALVKRLYI
jgi:hypothetical protein